MTRLLRAALVAALAASALFAVPAVGHEANPPTFLVFTGTYGFRHDGISEAVGELKQMAASRGTFDILEVDDHNDPALLEPEFYEDVDGVILVNTTGLGGSNSPLDATDRADFEHFVGCGGALVAIHAAADSGTTENSGWQAFDNIIGSRGFDSHPHFSFESREMPTGNDQQLNPETVSDVTFLVEDTDHPTGKAWETPDDDPTFTMTDEIYRYRKNPRDLDNLHVVISIDEQSHYWKTEISGGSSADNFVPAVDNPVPNPVNMNPVTAMPDNNPVAWVREYPEPSKQGRVFYTNLGHNMATWDMTLFQNHVAEGIEWVAGHPVDRTCTAERWPELVLTTG